MRFIASPFQYAPVWHSIPFYDIIYKWEFLSIHDLIRHGEGKSSGYRIIVYFKNKFRTLFVYGFTKSDRDNIDEGELKAFKIDAKEDFDLTDEQIEAWLKRGTLIEVQ